MKAQLWETPVKGPLWETPVKARLWETPVKARLWETLPLRPLRLLRPLETPPWTLPSGTWRPSLPATCCCRLPGTESAP